MGKYINTGNDGFQKARNDEYVDKSELIGFVNRALSTEHNMFCLTRARRFGKSMAAKMLCAYYDHSCDSRKLFEDLKISKDATFEQYLNQYPVIYLDITYFTSTARPGENLVYRMQREVLEDIQETYHNIALANDKPLIENLLKIAEHTKQRFIMVIDEWDAICREADNTPEIMRNYVDWLRSLFKTPLTDRVFAGVYMTGILPIIQYDTQSALNNFDELTMVSPGVLGGYFGFTMQEIDTLCAKYQLDKDMLQQWYDGYQLGEIKGIYNPYSVMTAIRKGRLENYWTTTGAYESLKKYIVLNFDGLRDAVVELMIGHSVKVNVLRFSNNLREIANRDAVLTALVHLGYLSYDNETEMVTIPNLEVRKEFEKTIADTGWNYVADAIKESENLLELTLQGDSDAVAKAIDAIHQDSASVLQYNDENSLACTLSLAYYAAKKDYEMIRELPTGKGFADIVLLPHKGVNKPALLLELKWDKSAQTAISQIRDKQYTGLLLRYIGEVVLVGVNYDKETKRHDCEIEHVGQSKSNTNVVKSNTNEDKSNINDVESNTNNEDSNTKRQKNQQSVLAFCRESDHTADEIFEHLGISRQAKHYDIYIQQLVSDGRLLDVTPERKRDKKYKTNGTK